MIIRLLLFNELSANQLYDLLRLRSEVFVVEQECIFLDMDNKDQIAMHLLIYDENELVACTRLFDKGQYYEETSIGRVVVNPKYRGKKLGHLLMNESIKAIEQLFSEHSIRIGAQCYLIEFYKSHGFEINSDIYLEDGIEHVLMVKK